ncbi:MAG: hypothetical protein DI535_24780 [Citrobacter freundii]|nr:MAG: hypothetical protein DI535_24780 [Citrobacter freundii]
MRTELELIEKIEQYLNNKLSPADQKAFEEQLSADPALRQELKLQQETMKGIERASLRMQVQAAGRRFNRGKNFAKGRWAVLAIFIIILSVLLYKVLDQHEGPGSEQNISGYGDGVDSLQLPALNESNDSNWARPDSLLPAQIFFINPSKDTVIETRDGIVVSIPANGFLDAGGNAANGSVQLVLKEALDAASIMKAGLSTMAGDRQLETGGMFFIDARQGEKVLKINPVNTLHVAIPSDTLKPRMQLFKGKRNKGGIDWTDPAPLNTALTTVDIQSLNFYPPLYLDSLKRWGYDITNKKFTDSLYYSFAGEIVNRAVPTPVAADTALKDEYRIDTSYSQSKDSNTIGLSSGHQRDLYYHACGLNPANVKAIWNDHFQNTFIATKQFEERMKYLHKIGVDDFLKVYIDNIDKDLFYADSLIAYTAAEFIFTDIQSQFKKFASRHDGNVNGGNKNAAKLAEYFRKKSKAYTQAITKTQQSYWNKQAKLDEEFYKKQSGHQQDSMNRLISNFSEEFELNLKDAWRQLGMNEKIVQIVPTENTYIAPVTTTGWYNIDRYVYESVKNQTTLDYTDQQTGKRAIIRYDPVSFRIVAAASFDRVSVYLLPDKLSSFIRLSDSSGVYSGKLDELMKYNMAVIAYKGDQAYLCSINNIQSRNYDELTLTAVSNQELKDKLGAISSESQVRSLKKESDFFRFEIKDLKRQKLNNERIRLRERLYRVIFPCWPDKQPVAPILNGPAKENVNRMIYYKK